ncbi:MAG TPA: hypothetical protein VEB88_05365, partial [Candidatus Acidoferrales bacterium]|nr:hypothetical protein [Candidatus Acidoferrales bacterium]
SLLSRLKTDKRLLLSVVGAAVAVVVVILLVAAAISPHPPSPGLDYSGYSSYYNSYFTGNGWTLVQPFSKSTNDRGNAVYTGIVSNVTTGHQYSIVVELTASQADAKSAYDQTVAQKTPGFTPRPDIVANDTAKNPKYIEEWAGQNGQTSYLYIFYQNNPDVYPSWQCITQSETW